MTLDTLRSSVNRMYKTLSSHYREKFGCKVYKLAIDGGFPARIGMALWDTVAVSSALHPDLENSLSGEKI